VNCPRIDRSMDAGSEIALEGRAGCIVRAYASNAGLPSATISTTPSRIESCQRLICCRRRWRAELRREETSQDEDDLLPADLIASVASPRRGYSKGGITSREFSGELGCLAPLEPAHPRFRRSFPSVASKPRCGSNDCCTQAGWLLATRGSHSCVVECLSGRQRSDAARESIPQDL